MLMLLVAMATSMNGQITFDEADYKAVGVYDTWEQSPFRSGELEGNVAIVDNPDTTNNNSAKVLGMQRSVFGSNTFGARIDLNETFELTTSTKYVHVLINKPRDGRVMLIGLGKRQDRGGQSAETEQFWQYSSTQVNAGGWCDAVFPIKGNGGIDIYSLVVAPDVESPHRLAEDFVVYIDDIEINSTAEPRIEAGGDYPIAFTQTQRYTRSDRGLLKIKLGTTTKTVYSSCSTNNLAYRYLDTQKFAVKPGQTVTPNVQYTGAPMHAYVYIDYGMDGKFAAEIGNDGIPTDGSDIVSYTYYDANLAATGKNSAGESAAKSGSPNDRLPAFTVPSSLSYGTYRMRYKVDWNSLDPAGRMDDANPIIQNGGAIVDIPLVVHGDDVEVSEANRNGTVTTADGTQLDGYKTPYGKAFKIKVEPSGGFDYDGVLIRHGYNLSGDSIVHGNKQWTETFVPKSKFNEENIYTIPSSIVDGDLQIEGLFVSTTIDVAWHENDKTVGEDKIYDLSGRRLNQSRPQQGLYIVNGKKRVLE